MLIIMLIFVYIATYFAEKNKLKLERNKEKYKWSLLIKRLTLVTSILLLFLSSCNMTNYENNKIKSSLSNDYKENVTYEETQYVDSRYEETIAETTKIEKETIQFIDIEENNRINGSVSNDQEKTFEFKATRTGIYGFDLESDDVNKRYLFEIRDAKNKVLDSKYSENQYTYYNNYVSNVELEANEDYIISISTTEEVIGYDIRINCPKKETVVTGNKIKGKIEYVGEEDIFYYIPSVSGVYRLDFDVDDVTKKYKVCLLNDKNKELETRYSLVGGLTCKLDKNKKYIIKVEYDTDFPQYIIKINKPQTPMTIRNGKIKGKIKYENQEDVYFYVPKRSGEYEFVFESSNAQNYYDIEIYDSKNEKIRSTYSRIKNVTGIELKKNRKYKIVVKHGDGFEKYMVDIKRMND